MKTTIHIVVIALLVCAGSACKTSEDLTPADMYERAVAFDSIGYEKEAGFWYLKAARTGHPVAQVEVAFMYRYGYAGILRDPYERMRWFLGATHRPRPMMLADFGDPYIYGRNGVLRDEREAEKWFQKAVGTCRMAAAAGNLEAQTLLGGLLGIGAGVPQDRQEAVRLWKDAGTRGHGPAQLILGRLYWHEGADTEAFTWTERAARVGLPEAEYLLSEMYQTGRGVASDQDAAMTWLVRSAHHGYLIAQRQLRGLEASRLSASMP